MHRHTRLTHRQIEHAGEIPKNDAERTDLHNGVQDTERQRQNIVHEQTNIIRNSLIRVIDILFSAPHHLHKVIGAVAKPRASVVVHHPCAPSYLQILHEIVTVYFDKDEGHHVHWPKFQIVEEILRRDLLNGIVKVFLPGVVIHHNGNIDELHRDNGDRQQPRLPFVIGRPKSPGQQPYIAQKCAVQIFHVLLLQKRQALGSLPSFLCTIRFRDPLKARGGTCADCLRSRRKRAPASICGQRDC